MRYDIMVVALMNGSTMDVLKGLWVCGKQVYDTF